jgi:hypothetical protein
MEINLIDKSFFSQRNLRNKHEEITSIKDEAKHREIQMLSIITDKRQGESLDSVAIEPINLKQWLAQSPHHKVIEGDLELDTTLPSQWVNVAQLPGLGKPPVLAPDVPCPSPSSSSRNVKYSCTDKSPSNGSLQLPPRTHSTSQVK